MDQEQPAAGDAANRDHRNEAVEAALVACRRDGEGLREFNDFVTEAAAGTTAVSGARSEDQRPRQASGNSGPGSGRVRTGATTASAAAAPVRQHEDDVKARDFREFDHFVKMHLQQQQTQQLLTRLQQPPSRSSAEGGGEVAPGPASLDLELRL
jgi:hypothetical protein